MQPPKPLSISYTFRRDDGREDQFALTIDSRTLLLTGNEPAEVPAWTALGFHQCPNCPLTESTHPHCPLALNLVNIVRKFDGLVSYAKIDLTVVTGDRTVIQRTTAQTAISSFMGLLIATSGCPHTVYLSPMARYHLPLANREETTYRATSMYLLAQYFVKQSGGEASLELEGLKQIYHEMEAVNRAIAKRLREASRSDSSVNAIVVLDANAKMVEMFIEDSLRLIGPLFSSYIERPPRRS
jgi:hypothetical protein